MKTTATLKFKTPTLSGSLQGNIPGVCQESFALIPCSKTRESVIAEITKMHQRMNEREASKIET